MHQCKGVAIAEFLLGTEIICETAIIHALYPVISSDARRSADCIAPAIVKRPASIGQHKAKTVHCTVGQDTYTKALADI